MRERVPALGGLSSRDSSPRGDLPPSHFPGGPRLPLPLAQRLRPGVSLAWPLPPDLVRSRVRTPLVLSHGGSAELAPPSPTRGRASSPKPDQPSHHCPPAEWPRRQNSCPAGGGQASCGGLAPAPHGPGPCHPPSTQALGKAAASAGAPQDDATPGRGAWAHPPGARTAYLSPAPPSWRAPSRGPPSGCPPAALSAQAPAGTPRPVGGRRAALGGAGPPRSPLSPMPAGSARAGGATISGRPPLWLPRRRAPLWPRPPPRVALSLGARVQARASSSARADRRPGPGPDCQAPEWPAHSWASGNGAGVPASHIGMYVGWLGWPSPSSSSPGRCSAPEPSAPESTPSPG